MECYIIRILLTVSRHGYDGGAWNIDWLSHDEDITVGGGVWVIDLLSESYLFVTHIWMVQILSNNIYWVIFIHWTIWWSNLFNFWFVIIHKSDVRNRIRFTIG